MIDKKLPAVTEDEYDAANETGSRSGCLRKAIALLALLVFLAFALPNFPYLFSNPLRFLDQNKVLMDDEIVKRCKPAVVSIESVVKNGSSAAEIHLGTGFNISSAGRIITNRHVVENAKAITVRFSDGRQYTVRQYETIPDVDIAIIQLEGKDLPTLALKIQGGVETGDSVTIIGNPLGFESISQRGQVGQIYFDEGGVPTVFDIGIEINPGNSGSPVINDQAEVVGILYASENIGSNGTTKSKALAIPIQSIPAFLIKQ